MCVWSVPCRFMNHMKHHLELEKQNSESWESHTTCQHCYRQYMTPFQLQCHIESAHSQFESSSMTRIAPINSNNMVKHTYWIFIPPFSQLQDMWAGFRIWAGPLGAHERGSQTWGNALRLPGLSPCGESQLCVSAYWDWRFLLPIPQVCKYRSSFFSDVETHFRTVHENTKELLCPFCLKILRSGHMYMQHYMKHQVCG